MVFNSILEAEADLVLSPGVELVFSGCSYLDVKDTGTLNAVVGAGEDAITLRGAEASAGFWGGVHFFSNSQNNVLDGVSVSGGGGTTVPIFAQRANVYIADDARARIDNCTISASAADGIRISSSANPLTDVGANNTFSGIGDQDINDEIE